MVAPVGAIEKAAQFLSSFDTRGEKQFITITSSYRLFCLPLRSEDATLHLRTSPVRTAAK